ncbi:MAG TPA: DUF4139 domain-containing protein [Bacteroidia bacterium]|nr:DUF4139 domain-containing protein [Bacteroidia bacterium]
MKNNLRLILAASLAVGIFSFTNADDVKNISSTDVKEVKVYLNGAMVSRTGKAVVEAGTTKIIFENLSSTINPQSISVSGKGDFTILSVVHQLNYLNSEKKTPEIKSFEDSLEAFNYKMSQLQNRKSVLNEEQNMLLANKSVGGANTGVNFIELKNISEYLRIRLADIKEKILTESVNEKKLKEKIDKVQQQLNTVNAKINLPTSTIEVTVSAKARTNAQFDMSYLVNNATWTPFYDVRSKDASSPVQLSYKANVSQNTGEDWDKVKLTLSTGNPALGGNKPELSTWYLNFYYPVRVYKNMMRKSEGAESTTPAVQDKLEDVAVGAKSLAEEITVNENQLSTDFEITIPYSIPSDGKQYAVDVQNYSLHATYNYYAVPKYDQDAFLTASVTGWQEYNLLPGSANVYFEGSYVGESYMDARTTEDTLHLSLGRDKKIVIKREQLKDFNSNQLIGGNRTKTLSFEISIRNTKKDAVQINVEDQLPLSQDKDIEVKMIEISGAEYNAETGKLTWKLNLAANETVKKKLTFSVKYPKDKVINGL